MTTPVTVDSSVAEEIANGLLDVRINRGWTRTATAEATGYTTAKIWRAEGNGGGVQPHEVADYRAFLAKVADGTLMPPVKPKITRPDYAAVVAKLVTKIEELEARLEDAEGRLDS